MKAIKKIRFWLSRRGIEIVILLLITVGALLAWFILSEYKPGESGIVLAIAAISAFMAAISAIANMLAAAEAQRQRENNERPYIQAFFDVSNSGAIYFTIQNFGNAPAFNFTIKFNIAPIDYAMRPLGEVSLFSKPINFIAPGQSYRQLVNIGYKLLAEGNPTKFGYTIYYSSSNYQKFSEKIEIDLSYLNRLLKRLL